MALSCIISEIKREIGRTSYPPCIRRPRYGSSRRSSAMTFGREKLEWLGFPKVKHFEDVLVRFDRMYERDQQRDRHRTTT